MSVLFVVLTFLQLAHATSHSFDFHIARKDIEISPGLVRPKTVVNGKSCTVINLEIHLNVSRPISWYFYRKFHSLHGLIYSTGPLVRVPYGSDLEINVHNDLEDTGTAVRFLNSMVDHILIPRM